MDGAPWGNPSQRMPPPMPMRREVPFEAQAPSRPMPRFDEGDDSNSVHHWSIQRDEPKEYYDPKRDKTGKACGHLCDLKAEKYPSDEVIEYIRKHYGGGEYTIFACNNKGEQLGDRPVEIPTLGCPSLDGKGHELIEPSDQEEEEEEEEEEVRDRGEVIGHAGGLQHIPAGGPHQQMFMNGMGGMDAHRGQINLLNETINQKSSKIEDLQRELSRSQSAITATREDYQRQISDLRTQAIKQLSDYKEQAQKEITELRSHLTSIQLDNSNKITEIVREKDLVINTLQQQKDQHFRESSRDKESALRDLEREWNQRFRELESKKEDNYKNAEREYRTNLDMVKREVDAQKMNVTRLESDLRNKEIEIERVKSESHREREMTRIQADQKSEMARIRSDIDRHRDDRSGAFQDKMLGFFMNKQGADPMDGMEKMIHTMNAFRDLTGGGDKEEEKGGFMETMGTVVGAAAKAMNDGNQQAQPQPAPFNNGVPPEQIAAMAQAQAASPRQAGIPVPPPRRRKVRKRQESPKPPVVPSPDAPVPNAEPQVRDVSPEAFEQMKQLGLIMDKEVSSDMPVNANSDFREFLNNGLKSKPDPLSWATAAVENFLTEEGKTALLEINEDAEIVPWIKDAGFNPLSLISVLADTESQKWIRDSVTFMKQIIVDERTPNVIEQQQEEPEESEELAQKGE